MVATIKTFAFNGIEVLDVDVQVKITNSIRPSFNIVGLGDKAVAESKERVQAAITSTGMSWPAKKITVNLAPADIQKEGSHYDLAIALGLMVEMGILQPKLLEIYFVLGELALNGSISKVNGIISAAMGANARNMGIICPQINGKEAAWASAELDIIAAPDLLTLINHLKDQQTLSRPKTQKIANNHKYPDFNEVKGQKIAKRALEVAAAGNHNLLMIGHPGAGKSMLASRIPSILPPLELGEILEVNIINSISGKIADGKLYTNRPFREVHHSCSMPAMIGGGNPIRPGEISLSHQGVLFLDELAEFPRQVLDSLRQPLENKNVTISRVNSHVNYPANFQLIAAMNPCRCGYLGDEKRECSKAPICGQDYKNKISGPLLDRIDIIIEVPITNFFSEEEENNNLESSNIIRQRVVKARNIQKERFVNNKNDITTNSQISGADIEKICIIDAQNKEILKTAAQKLNLSMRGISRIIKVSRTIADLDGKKNIEKHHLLEAISYRREL